MGPGQASVVYDNKSIISLIFLISFQVRFTNLPLKLGLLYLFDSELEHLPHL